ncbi:helicase-related protein [Wolbachia endosymbiont (group B) of Pandemis corylana]|uniref:helicase-related protein n=1 Tax=Wolbachia endosymbiont (group B) of Pandemis corylana TaxID=2954039 RepID=UPI00222686A1|nr:helicase-related protein [Wolbachia endosymbiont (group B) of Pandemis corylana]
MFNVQNQQISDSGRNVSSVLNIEQAIECLNSWGVWTGSESWLASTAEELNKRYRELRKDIRENTNSWSYSQYCERLAYHYYNLACYCNDELFNKHKVDLESIKQYLEKCLEKLAEVSGEGYSDRTKELKNDAEKFLTEVKKIHEQQEDLLTKYSTFNKFKKYTKLCIVLGSINQVPLQQCSAENRQQIQNIQLLRVINMLEDAITVPEYKNTFITAEQSDYLGQAYQLAGQPTLSMRYKRTSDNLKKTVNVTEKHNDKRQEIKDIISKEIAEHKSDLAQVKNYIEEKFHKSLSTIDDAYIEKKYIKYCARFWLQETTNFLKELNESKSRTIIQEIFNSLDDIQGLSQIPNPLNRLQYYTLLMEHYKLVRKEDEKVFISRFKKECLEQIVAYSDSAEKELVFLETFVDFLSSSKNLQSIIVELELEDFCRGDLSFDKLINNIMKLEVDTYGENLIVLKKVTEGLKEKEDLFLIDKFKEVIGAYIKPVEVQERRIDGRLVVEVTGKNIVVSEILWQLENTLSENSNIEEVLFVGADVIHIDTNFKSEVWQGKNVVILTKTIKVHDKVTWDVSGKDNNHTYSDNAGTGKDGHGKQGADGHAGESGGNVLILAEKIEGQENFTIISNGGKGSKGQDGGNGESGEDGKSITEAEFKEKFPPAAKFTHVDRANNILKTINNIKKDSQVIISEWYESKRGAFPFKRDVTFNEEIIEEVIKDSKETKERHGRSYGRGGTEKCPFEGNIFINAMTNQENEIIFSFERGGKTTNCQAFLLYKGSLGQPGGHGGEYGLGGQGGYAGEITVKNPESSQEFNTIREVKQGKEGEKGQGGLYGNHGENGWDMGYMDYSVSEFFTEEWPKFPGVKEKSKVELKYYSDNSSKRIRCPYKERKGEGDIYAELEPSKIEHKKQKRYEERKSTRQNSERQHHAQAVRKKNISQSSILANYSHHLSSMEKNTLQNLRSDLENTKQQALQAITENQEQQEKQTTELKIKRHSPYQNKSKHYNDISTTTPRSNREIVDVEDLISELKNNLDNWSKLKDIELSLSQLDQLFSNFEALKNRPTTAQGLLDNTKNSKLRDIENLLIDKYRLATLQEIAKRLSHYQKVTDNVELTPESAARYLVEAKENDSNISHDVLGTLNQYFYEHSKEQSEKISKFGKEELQNTENKALKYSIRAFVLEVGKLEEEHTDVKKYYNEYKEFLEKQERSLNIFFEAFKSELSQPRHAEIFDLWIKSVKDKSLISKLEEKIQEDNFLKVLYDRFNNQLELEYDWDKCCKDQAILKEYNDYIQEKGPLSGSYRELLAYVFGINIRLYAEDQDNRLFLRGDHNPSSKKIIHILCRDNKFIQLNIDKNYLKLEEERKKKDSIYAQIFAEIRPFKQKQEFDDYLNNQAFLSNNSPSEDEQYFNEEEDIEKIIEYFPEGEKQQLKERLNKITSQYIGQQGILHNMLKSFSSEGRHVSSQELCCLVNSILTFIIEDRKEMNIFCWIVAAYPQKSWIDELILLQLEDYFKKTLIEKPEWRKYLSKIESKDVLLLFKVKLDQHKSSNPISTQCIEDILHLLSNIPNETVSLEGLELSEWPYALKEKYWTCKLSKLVDWQKDDLPTASYYLLSIENIFGALLSEKFIEALEKKKQELSSDKLTNILSNFHNEKWNLSTEELNTLTSCRIDDWAQKMQEKFTANKEERKITQLVELIKSNANTSKEILNKLPKIKNYIESIDKYITAEKPIGSFTEDDIKNWVKEFQSNMGKGKQDVKEEMLAVIYRAIELKKELELKRVFKLRDTQKLTVLALLTNDRSTLAQVSTGEGKSLIVVAASIMKALCGEKVDVITSSSVLAKRDAEDNRDIYSLFGINVSHNCSEDIEKRKEAYSGNQVVYGDLSNFQRDYLLDKFYGKNILGDRNFNNVIVDEVDSMLLDKGNNMLYLSHDLAGLDKLESVYIYIWQWINRPARDNKELCYAFDAKAIKEAVISDLYGLVKKEDIGKLGSELSEQQKNIMWERLIKTEILDDQGKLLKGNINDNELNKVLSPEFNCYKDRFLYLLKECIEREKFIHVPNNLRPFIEQHLESWINNAITAFFMKAGEDYVVDVDKTGSSPDRNPNITILDRDTGTDQANSQWDEALHQFLQLKHGCKLSLQSLKAVFISNVSFFKLYSNLYGLTGTLGSQRERDLLQEIHEVDFVTIPTAKSKQFHEEKPILCTGKDEWIKCIYNEAKKLTEEKKRSVLIICETVNDVETLHKAFGGKDAKHVHTYTRDYEEFDKGFEIVQDNKELGQGQIIIATNLAGRGTDIKITEGLKKARGLHVCLTYLPSNIRVEQQAFGRAARSGDQGSGQLIIMDSKGQEYSNSKILDLKKERDVEELHRISDIKAYYDTQITMEESCFKAFKEQYEQLKKDLDDKKVPTEVKEILLQSCLDKWAFWLDEHTKYVRNLTGEQDKRNLYNLLDKFISRLNNLDTGYSEKWLPSYEGPPALIIEYDSTNWLAWVKENPIQMIKLGKYLSQNEEHKNAHKNALELFDEVIKKEPYFSEAARYYKAFALVKKVDLKQKPLKEEDEKVLKEFKQELREAARLLDEHSKFAINAAGIIGKIKKNNNESIIQIDAYEEQQKSLANLYYMFSRSIDDIFGHTITPQSFANNDIKEELAESLYKDLLEKGMLKKPRIKKSISEEELKVISAEYGVSVETLKNFLSKYEGKEINEKEFQKKLKKEIQLPSREAFWKSLVEQKILNEEVKCVVVNNEKLKETDPSLLDHLTGKINQKELEKQTLELNNEQILLNVEWVTQQKNKGNIFKKDDFIKIVGKDKYKILKERGVLSFNRKAHIDQSKIESMTFPCYDSITLEDFTKVNITKSEAEKILAELAKQKVIEKKDGSENNAYGLKIKFDEIKQVQLSFCPVYENVLKGLLSTCFTYRIALQKIAVQLEEKNFPVRLQLITKPHQSLVLELLEQKIIRPTVVATKDEDLEEKLKSIYSQKMTKDNFKCILSKSTLIQEECIEKLFGFLVEKGWITKYDPMQSIQDEGIRAISKENIKNAGKSLVQDLYYINSPDKRQKPLNFFPEGSHENVPTKSQSIDKTVEKVLDNQLQLAKKDTIKNIVSTLKRSRSSLKALKVPDSKLKSLTEFCGQGEFANIEEVHVFFLNGLDQLLQLEEKKWTQEMLINTVAVTAMGVSQIAIGTTIELYSMGVMTHVGAAFVNEGVNDLFFAAGALKSGYFSWEDYRQHKLESLMVTAATVGIGAYLSRGTKVSRFGHKLAGPNFEFGKKVAEISGTQLIKATGWKIIGKEVAKRITLKTIEGLALGLANAGVDTLVENYLQALCEGIASEILSNIEQEVENHNISASLEKAYEVLGREEAKKVIDGLTNSVFTEQNCVEKFLPVANKIVSSVTQGIAEAVKKRSTTSNKLELPIHTISKVVVWSERAAHIGKIPGITGSFLDNLDRKIKDENTKRDLPTQRQEAEIGYKVFKKETTDQWKSLLREKAGQIIAQYIVGPILKEGANHLVRYVGRKIGEAYQSYKESEYLEHFEELKQEYKEKLQSEQQCDNTSKAEDHMTEKYHEDLRKLMIKTRNPDLLADIVRENIPMDMTCVNACTQVVYKILKEQGVVIPGLIVIVQGNGGIRQEFSSISEGTGRIIIPLELKDNHFEFCGSSTSENSSESKNNCLYEALSEAIPGLRNIISPEGFRDKVADCIKHDKGIRYHIQQGWHRLPISLGAFGGKRYISVPTSTLNEQAENQSPYQHSNSRGEWKFDKNKDVDLREDRVLTNKESHLQRAKAYNEALDKINQALSNIGKKRISVDPTNFKATRYDTILCTGKFGKIDIALYPVEMEATVEIWVRDIKENVKYTLIIDVDNPIIESDLQGPHGPHVGYDVIRHNKQAPEGVTGHILINPAENKRLPDRSRSQYSIDDNSIPTIPITRVFFPPNKPNTYLERVETGNISQINNRAEIRGRSYPSPDF